MGISPLDFSSIFIFLWFVRQLCAAYIYLFSGRVVISYISYIDARRRPLLRKHGVVSMFIFLLYCSQNFPAYLQQNEIERGCSIFYYTIVDHFVYLNAVAKVSSTMDVRLRMCVHSTVSTNTKWSYEQIPLLIYGIVIQNWGCVSKHVHFPTMKTQT